MLISGISRKELRALRGYFGSHMRPKNEIRFSSIPSYWFIRTMTQVCKSDISFTFTVAMVTKNRRQNRLKIGKLPFWSKFETFDRAINIEHEQIPKIYFNR